MTAFKALQEQNRYGPAGHVTHYITHRAILNDSQYLLTLQSRRHGLILRLHLGRHHPGVSHTYPSCNNGHCWLKLLFKEYILSGVCLASLFFCSDIHHKRGETEKRQIAVSLCNPTAYTTGSCDLKSISYV